MDKLNLEWPEDVNLVQAFIIADKIHRLIEQNEGVSIEIGANYLNLVCVGYAHDDLRPDRGYSWVASFDTNATEPEWFETVDAFRYSAKGYSPEEVIRAAAVKVRDAFVKARKEIDR
jgi:hypothetical protein